jgi:hypothetical protein
MLKTEDCPLDYSLKPCPAEAEKAFLHRQASASRRLECS